MTVLSVLLGSLAAATVIRAAPAPSNSYERHNQHRSAARYIVPRAPAVALAEHTLPLERRPVPPGRAHRPRPWQNLDAVPRPVGYAARKGNATLPGGSVTVGAAPAANHDIEYITQVIAGANNLSVVVDTGSSDTWFVRHGFACIDPQYGTVTISAVCGFGPAFKGDFPGGAIADQHLSVAYGTGSGPFIVGQMGYSDLQVSGFKTDKQVIGLATEGYWDGDGVTSGLLGLGLPGLTNAFAGSLLEANTLSGQLHDQLYGPILYSPLVSTLAAANNISQFSLALSRDPGESVLALGGAPPGIDIDPKLGWVTTPIVKMALNRGISSSGSGSGSAAVTPSYAYYTIAVDGFIFNSSTLVRNFTAVGQQPLSQVPIIVDSGTTLNLLPYEIAEAINQMFVPHAQLDPDQGLWFVRCDATPPSLGVQIGGKTIWTDPKSMIMTPTPARDGGVSSVPDGLCLSGISTRSGTPYILGDVFMQQLVTVFDTGNHEIKFGKRLPRASASAGKKGTKKGTAP
ncbi:hypothetical protein SCUCBS95973_008574 [Sporothrix curviconia]|uniref:Peptidase A1 domain-containing protein n=1 Tax=Sporothrix curviconia TaxID=1260050 RepID=A0ABP0CMQ0_9PEZI